MSRAREASQLRGLRLLCLVLLVFAGCGGSHEDGSSSGVRLILRTTPVEEQPNQRVSPGPFDSFSRQIQPGDISFVKCVEITVTGPGITGSVEEMLNVSPDQQNTFTGRLTKTVPSGNNRRIDVVACNESQVGIFEGETTVDLGQQSENCEALVAPDADSLCRVTLNLRRLAVWGIFRWGEAQWMAERRICRCPET